LGKELEGAVEGIRVPNLALTSRKGPSFPIQTHSRSLPYIREEDEEQDKKKNHARTSATIAMKGL